MKKGIAGSVESNDCLITVMEVSKRDIEIHSIVDAFFHDQILKVIIDTLDERHLTNIQVIIEDKGALDYTIKARLITALSRMEDYHA